MQLLDRYIESIAQKLPRRERLDVASEIRSTLQDMLEDRSQAAGRPVDEAMLREALAEYGSPARVAATYLPERYLVGPQLYPIFILVVKIVLSVLTALALAGLGIALFSAPINAARFVEAVGGALASYYQIMLTAFGNIVLVFAILQRVLPAKELENRRDEEEEWDPEDLLKEPATDEVKLWEPIVAILFTFAALVVFNFYPHLLRYTPSLNDFGAGRVIWLPLFSEAFFSYLPWLNVLWLAGIAFNLLLLRARRWTTPLRLFSIGVKLFTIWVLFMLLRGPALLDFSAQALAAWPVEIGGIERLGGLLNTLLRIALGLGIFGSVVEVLQEFYRLLFRRPAPEA